MTSNRPTEQTPLTSTLEEGRTPRSTSPTAATFSKGHLQTFQKKPSHGSSPLDPHKLGSILPPKPTGAALRAGLRPKAESDDVLAIRSKQSKNRARKNVGAFRRKRQDYATWKGRVGVHVETDEFDLKNLVNVIYQTLGTEWELGESCL